MQKQIVTDEALQASVKKAVELGILPKHDFAENVADNYEKIK